MKAFFSLICLLLVNLCFGVDQLHKGAVLMLPESIECELGTGYYLSGEIGLRWDGAQPLKMSVWKNSKADGVERLMASLAVFDETGREVDQQFFVSLPPMPTGEVIVGSGERRQFQFFVWNGAIMFRRPGNYYAIATFSDAWTHETNVQFTTSKRWFKVVEAPPKPKST
jgi:hypothetical protein